MTVAPAPPRVETTALFVGGVPRGGVAAVGRLLSADRRIALGLGRYTMVLDRVDPFLLQPAAFLAPTRHETGPGWTEANRLDVQAKIEAGARYIGDVAEGYLDRLEVLAERFPHARFVIVYRAAPSVLSVVDEARRSAVEQRWVDVMQYLRGELQTRAGHRIFVADHARLAAGDFAHAEALWRSLGLELPAVVDERIEQMRERAAPSDRPAVTPAAQELDAWIAQHIDAQGGSA